MIGVIYPIALIALASIADGILEGYTFDGRKSFERKYKVKEDGFWGHLSWEKKGGWYEKLNGVFDFYHVADDIRKYAYIAPFLILYYQKEGFNIKSAAYLTVVIIASMAAKRIAMWWIRK